jgi:hypothetical protein
MIFKFEADIFCLKITWLVSEYGLNISFPHSFQISQEEFDKHFVAKNNEDSGD